MENWREIPGYEGLYEASDCGRIRTCEGKTTSNARCKVRVWKQRILKLKLRKRKNGLHSDARVNLWKDGEEKTFLVARLVAMAWCTGYEEGLTVNHIDGNPENNAASNLEWVSLERNIQMGFETGLFPQKPCVLISENGEHYEFRSYSQAGRFLNRNNDYIKHNIYKGKFDVTASDGTKYHIESY